MQSYDVDLVLVETDWFLPDILSALAQRLFRYFCCCTLQTDISNKRKRVCEHARVLALNIPHTALACNVIGTLSLHKWQTPFQNYFISPVFEFYVNKNKKSNNWKMPHEIKWQLVEFGIL